ncbi:hypothetical protein CYLTODRAFT_489146 [Cylindrobasidium torrendii FP15055 ss-10]|uniref:Uncharacterized protein n=1 Tax=Cylindrobasidium torrendii FP15055 ss-10 TaxID=1314674 RepID=A0A0D7BHK2_9AGAR|nr:hypothetical protein CYLTODRAFT_489146 [Cylindrobasidium torrendii FP15055 ss-10]
MPRPRESVLSLFDPLHSEDDGHQVSDDEGYSDKENSAPSTADMTLGSYFSAFKHPVAQPRALKHRLVDVGDATLDESHFAAHSDGETDDDIDENSMFGLDRLNLLERTPKHTSTVALRSIGRAPLSEITPDAELTPGSTGERGIHRRLFPPKANTIGHFKRGSLLEALGQSLNDDGILFGEEQPPSQAPLPAIQVSSPEVAPFSAEFSDVLDSADVDCGLGMSIARPRRKGGLSSSAKDRLSLDLHASFQMQFDADDTSFDLLNDKISFFAGGRELDIASGDEDDLDDNKRTPPFGAVNGRDALRVRDDVPETPRATSMNTIAKRPPSFFAMDSADENMQSPVGNESLVDQRRPVSLFEEPASDNEEENAVPSAMVTPAPTRLAHAPPPVQALRVKKRTDHAAGVAPAPRKSAIRAVPQVAPRQSLKPEPTRTVKSSSPRVSLAPAVKPSTATTGARRVPQSGTQDTITKSIPVNRTTARRVPVADHQRQTSQPATSAISRLGSAVHSRAISVATRSSGQAPSVRDAATRPVGLSLRSAPSMSRLPTPGFGLKGPTPAKPRSGILAPRRA